MTTQPMTRAEALAVLTALMQRNTDSAAPELAYEGAYHELDGNFMRRPLSETRTLIARRLFAPSAIDPEAAGYLDHVSDAWFA